MWSTLYTILKAFLGVLYRIAADIDIIGLENMPRQGPLIVVTNHMSWADPPLIALAMPVKLGVMAAEKYEHHPLFGPILRSAGAVFINRGEVDRAALKRLLDLLKAGGMLGMAPEGTRSHVGSLIPAKTGAAYLASRTNATILPVGITGTEAIFRNLLHLRRTHLRVIIGKPFRLPDGRARSQDLDAYTEFIMAHIAHLLPPEYRGAYTNSSVLAQLQNTAEEVTQE